MRKLKTVVCGSTFGQFYLEALSRDKERFELCGLVAGGSERSKKCAGNYGIMLYDGIEALPEDIDLACVVLRSNVLGGKGTELAVELMKRGIHVLQEHPIHPKDLILCYKTAKEQQVFFQTGNLYANLPEVRKFTRCARELNKLQKPAYINVRMAAQVSYPGIEILMQAMGSIHKWSLKSSVKDNGPFVILSGTLDDIPVTFEIHNEIYPQDPDNHMYLLHSISFVYKSGRLTLEDTFGPVIWNPRMYVSTELYERGKVTGNFPEYMSEVSASVLGEFESNSFQKLMEDVWTEAVLEDALSIRGFILNEGNYACKAQREVACSQIWNDITRDMGYAKMIENCKHCVVTAKELETVIEREA